MLFSTYPITVLYYYYIIFIFSEFSNCNQGYIYILNIQAAKGISEDLMSSCAMSKTRADLNFTGNNVDFMYAKNEHIQLKS